MIVMMTRVMTATKTAVDVDSIENEKNMRWLAQCEVVVAIYMRWLSQFSI